MIASGHPHHRRAATPARVLRRWLARGSLSLALALPASLLALDEVVLTNGRRYLGTVVASSPETIVLSIDGGTVEFPRSAVASPPHFGPIVAPAVVESPTDAAFDPRAHPLPPLRLALRQLREFSWAASPRQVPVLVTDRGRWKYVPSVSFWVGGFCQVSCYGDPARPAAIEVSLHHPQPDAWAQKRDLLEYMMGLVPGLATDNRFDSLNIHGDSFAVGDLWFSVSPPTAADSPDRWTVRLIHETSVAAARATIDEIHTISEPIAETVIDPSKPRSWQRGSWTVDELAWLRQAPGAAPDGTPAAEAPAATPLEKAGWSALGTERVFVRSFTRERGAYARSANDWMREFAAHTPAP